MLVAPVRSSRAQHCAPAPRQNRSSAEHLQLATAFETHGDLHSGWRPHATVAQHLCTGSDDLEVPPLISARAARRWGVTLLTMQGKGHTDGIVACVKVALNNLTAHAAPAPHPGAAGAAQRKVVTRLEPEMPCARVCMGMGMCVCMGMCTTTPLGGELG